jgi:hypothetical protein
MVDRPGIAPGFPACKAGVFLLDDATQLARDAGPGLGHHASGMSVGVLLPGRVALQRAQQCECHITRPARHASQRHAGLLRRAAGLAVVLDPRRNSYI